MVGRIVSMIIFRRERQTVKMIFKKTKFFLGTLELPFDIVFNHTRRWDNFN